MGLQLAQHLSESGLVPDSLIRHGIRKLLQQRLEDIEADDIERSAVLQQQFVQLMRAGPVAEVPDKANEQHYEVPTDFFLQCLGEQLKYSCGFWPEGVTNLDASETAALQQTCDHARLQDGMQILELGCGWGSLTLWMARHYPAATITAVSNSRSQGDHIRLRAAEEGLSNVTVITADMNAFETEARFDRVVSVEMFEHMRNWENLYRRVSGWLKPDGCFFKHIFVHRSTPYLFEDRDDSDWMSRHFFSGGMMPSADLPLYFQDHLKFEQRWFWDGRHYEQTSNAWLEKMDAHRAQLWPLFEDTYGKDFAKLWWMRWRMFFMACAELFGYRDGQEWRVGHYLFSKRADA